MPPEDEEDTMTALLRTPAATEVARVHLLGAGPVGRAFLNLVREHEHLRIVALSDSQATVYARTGLDTEGLEAFKADGGTLGDLAARCGRHEQ